MVYSDLGIWQIVFKKINSEPVIQEKLTFVAGE